jgi:hypothetical protein
LRTSQHVQPNYELQCNHPFLRRWLSRHTFLENLDSTSTVFLRPPSATRSVYYASPTSDTCGPAEALPWLPPVALRTSHTRISSFATPSSGGRT